MLVWIDKGFEKFGRQAVGQVWLENTLPSKAYLALTSYSVQIGPLRLLASDALGTLGGMAATADA